MTDEAYKDEDVVLYHGDCVDVMKELGPVDAIVTDPPYNIDFEQNYYSNRKRKNWSQYVDAALDYGVLASEFWRLLKEPGSAYICVGYDNYVDWYRAMAEVGFNYPGYLVWDKGNATWLAGNYGVKWKQRTELIMHWIKGRPSLALPDEHNILRYPRPASGQHPCEKPVELMERLIRQSCLVDGLVLDPFVGSGSTLVAAKLQGRRAIGVEIQEGWCKVAADRLRQGVLICP